MLVAAAQARSVAFDPGATTARTIDLMEQAAARGVELLAFPEAFLSGYPFWVMMGATGGLRDDQAAGAYATYLDAAVELDGPELRAIGEASRELGLFVFLGISERAPGAGRGTVYCTLVAIDPVDGLVGAHRKLIPTHGERLVWGQGDGDGLRTHRFGGFRVGGLSCWENWMPLARYSLYADGEDLQVATWPGTSALNREHPPIHRPRGSLVRHPRQRAHRCRIGRPRLPVSRAHPDEAAGSLRRWLLDRRPRW